MTEKKNSLLHNAYAVSAASFKWSDAIIKARNISPFTGKVAEILASQTKKENDLKKALLQAKALPLFNLPSLRVGLEFQKHVNRWAEIGAAAQSWWQRNAREFESLFAYVKESRLLDEAGWLSNPSMPYDLLESCNGDAELLHERLEVHFEQNWRTIAPAILQEAAFHRFDDESDECLEEALALHGERRFRSVCRMIFPEIERIARCAYSDNPFEQITSVKNLRACAGEQPLGPKVDWRLFEKLEAHMYDKVKTEASLERFRASRIPNRHACIHGLIVYNKPVNSLNAIFTFAYVLQVVAFSRKLNSSLDRGS